MVNVKLALGLLVTALVAVVLTGQALAAPPEGKGPGGGGGSTSLPKPKLPGAQGAVQAGAEGTFTITNVDRAEMQLQHNCPIPVPTAAGSAYSYSLVGETTGGYTLRMGYIVLQSDGAGATCYLRQEEGGGTLCCSGWARWFIQVFDRNGNEVYWKLSRAGEANPPRASSASSGDDTNHGYPFSFVVSGSSVTFYFDWISKANVRLTSPGKITKVYFLGEVMSTQSGEIVGPATALTTFRVWNGGPSWVQPERTPYYNGTTCSTYGVAFIGQSPWARNDGVHYDSTRVGSGVGC